MKDINKYKYELVVVLDPKAETKDKESCLKEIEEKIQELKFNVDNRENLGNKNLAYKVKKLDKGDFWVFEISGKEAVKAKNLTLFLNRDKQVIRYLMLKI